MFAYDPSRGRSFCVRWHRIEMPSMGTDLGAFGDDDDESGSDREVIAGSTHEEGVKYQGFVPPAGGWTVERVAVSSLTPQVFFEKYVKARRPVVLYGDLPDPEWKGKQWTIDYLKKKAGAARVKVEPVGPAGSFGTATKRIPMMFVDFLKRVVDQKDEGLYLTTQYEEEDEGEGEGKKKDEKDGGGGVKLTDAYPEPTAHLLGDFPTVPALLGNLLLNQVNLWVGRSARGTSSGLHHDHHDNLYVLLQGRKRFTLFPPSDAPRMHTHGELHCVHPNGVICYRGARTRADGLRHADVAQRLMERAEEAIDGLEAKGQAAAGERRRLEGNIDRWLRELAWADAEADEDARLARRAAKARPPAAGPPEPRSFSRVPVDVLRASERDPGAAKAAGFAGLEKGRRGTAELAPGDMLYLPASWFHEVTSASGDDAAPHIAWNYWLHPPDGARFEEPYGEGRAILEDRDAALRALAAARPRPGLPAKKPRQQPQASH